MLVNRVQVDVKLQNKDAVAIPVIPSLTREKRETKTEGDRDRERQRQKERERQRQKERERAFKRLSYIKKERKKE